MSEKTSLLNMFCFCGCFIVYFFGCCFGWGEEFIDL